MRGLAIHTLDQHRISELTEQRDECAAQVWTFEHELAIVEGRISWVDRANFVSETVDQATAKVLNKGLDAAKTQHAESSAALAKAITDAAAEHPPLDIAFRVEAVIARVLSDRRIGRELPSGKTDNLDEVIRAELQEIANRVTEVWLPHVDTTRVASMLRASTKSAVAERDERLGWQPVSTEELIAIASKALHTPEHTAARQSLQRESHEFANVSHVLEQARKQIGLGDHLSFGKTPNEQRVNYFERVLRKEQNELVHATEVVHHDLQRALWAYPPLAIYEAALTACEVLSLPNAGFEYALRAPSGTLQRVVSAYRRAVFLTALCELRRACDIAFDDLTALITGRDGDLKREERRRGQGPYRQRGDKPEALPAKAPVQLARAIEQQNVKQPLATALSHAVMLGAIGRLKLATKATVTWRDRLEFWSDSDDQSAVSNLKERAKWHRSVSLGAAQQASMAVARGALELPEYRLRDAIIRAHLAVKAIHTRNRTSTVPIDCPVFGQQTAIQAVSVIQDVIGRAWGPRHTKWALGNAIAYHLRSSPAVEPPVRPGQPLRVLTYEELFVTLAEALRNTDFSARHARLMQVQQQHQHTLQWHRWSDSQISTWDRINVFSQSTAEQRAAQWSAQERSLASQIHTDLHLLDVLLDRALLFYPPAVLYYALHTAAVYVQMIRATSYARRHRSASNFSTNTYYVCNLDGKDVALNCLQIWTARALRVFGVAATNSELLEWFAAQQL